VNDDLLTWLEKKYGDNDIEQVTAARGKRHDYSKHGQVNVNMIDYIKNPDTSFHQDTGERLATTPRTASLFKVNEKSKRRTSKIQEEFHIIVAQGLFVMKRAGQDLQPGIAYR
jgi:hypothetical protein